MAKQIVDCHPQLPSRLKINTSKAGLKALRRSVAEYLLSGGGKISTVSYLKPQIYFYLPNHAYILSDSKDSYCSKCGCGDSKAVFTNPSSEWVILFFNINESTRILSN